MVGKLRLSEKLAASEGGDTEGYRGDMDDSPVQGHGIGLPIARDPAQAMSGNLVYRPGELTGSNFVVSLRLGSAVGDHDDGETSERVPV